MSLNNLPGQSTSFIGRKQEIAETSSYLSKDDCRLVTLVGPGGIGKTRLALAIGETQVSNFADGVWLVRLQSIKTTDWIVPTIAEAIGLSLQGVEEPHQQLLSHLSDKSLLLLVDNYEHLIDNIGLQLLTDILEAAPSVKLLVTSREALKLQEEWRYLVSGLSTPSANADTHIDLETYEAIQLFITRAYTVYPRFNLVQAQDCVVHVCRLVDGMPLAIEMATSWLSSLPCPDIATKIEQGLLDTRLRNVPERHHSILAVLEQSWKLLTEEERDIFSKLSVFVGGFHSEAVEAIADTNSHALATFVDKSLLQLDNFGRYWIHELARQFAQEKLNQFPAKKAATLDLHCEYYANFLKQREQKFRVEQSPEILSELAKEVENLRAMWRHAIVCNKIDSLQAIVRFLAEYYDFRHWYHEGTAILQQIIELSRNSKPMDSYQLVLGVALAGRGNLLHNLGNKHQAEEQLREGISILHSLAAKSYLVWALSHLNRLLFDSGSYQQAEKSYRESIALARETGDIVTLAYEVGRFGYIVSALGRYNEAKQLRQEALLHFQHLNHRLGEALTLGAISETLYILGDYEQAQSNLQEALTILLELDSQWHIADQLQRLGQVALALGQYIPAKQHLHRSLEIAYDVGDPSLITRSHLSFGDLYCILNDYTQAKHHFQKALHLSQQTGLRLYIAHTFYGIGKLAYKADDYSSSEKHLRESLTLYQEMKAKLDIAKTLCELGRVAIQRNNETEVKGYFYEALRIAVMIESEPLILDTLVAIAEFIASQNKHATATQLLTFSFYHSACHAATIAQIEYLLNKLEKLLPTEEFTTAQQSGQQDTLEDIVHNWTLVLSASQTNAHSQSNRALHEPLTRRELDVLKLVVNGYTNRAIAGQLHISVNTVKKHINHIFSKLDVENRKQVIARTQKLDILP